MRNIILEYLEEKIAVEKQGEIARKMIDKGYDSLDIIEITGISPEHLRSLRDVAKNKVV